MKKRKALLVPSSTPSSSKTPKLSATHASLIGTSTNACHLLSRAAIKPQIDPHIYLLPVTYGSAFDPYLFFAFNSIKSTLFLPISIHLFFRTTMVWILLLAGRSLVSPYPLRFY